MTQRLPDVRIGDEDAEVLYSLVEEMKETITSDRNSIWTFILKNVYRPIFLKRQFDIVVGNPPWLSYRYVERGEYQRFLKEAISKDYTLLGKKKGHLITHLELGTLFFCASLNLYTHENGKVAFVLPRSVFTGDQHDAFRKAEFSGMEPKAGITGLWDLENVSPIFNVPACVVFGGKKEKQKFPIAGKIFKGTVPRKNAQLREAMENLETKDAKYHLAQQGERSYWSVDPYLKVTAKSPYITKFFQGATIVPRSCWFVEIKPQEHLGFTPTKPYVKTDARATQHAKQDYKDLILEGNIESDFLYATLLSTDLLPFGYLDHRMVVLPIQPSSDNFKILNAAEARLSGFQHLSDWLEKCEKEWEIRRREKADRMTIYERLNRVRGLTQQNYKAKYKVIYPTSATNICGAVIENMKITKEVGGQRLKLNSFIVESTFYCYDTDDKQEAYYLSAILNSHIIDELLKPMQARGLWGARHIHKKIWELPIPGFREDNADHRKLAELGMQCTEKVKEIIPTLDTQNVTPGKIGRLRGKVRKLLEREIGEIDGAVEGLVG